MISSAMDSELSRAGSKNGLKPLSQQQQIVLCSECHDRLIGSLVKAQPAAATLTKLKAESDQLPRIPSRNLSKKLSSKYSK